MSADQEANQMDRLTAERHNELHGLRFHWGQYYGFTVTSGRWSAARLGNRRVIVAASAGELSIKVVDDHTERPVPRPGVSDEKAKP
jgi:roadblock/LC7 domain-containing protein